MKQRPFQQPEFYAYLLKNGPATTRQVMDRLAQPSLSCTFDLLRRMVVNGWAKKHGTRAGNGFTWSAIPGMTVTDRRGSNGTPNPAGKPRRKRREEPPIVFCGTGRIALEECLPTGLMMSELPRWWIKPKGIHAKPSSSSASVPPAV